MTEGEFVAFLTHDAKPVDDRWLRILVDVVEQREDIAAAFGRHIAYPNASPFMRRDIEAHFDNYRSIPSILTRETDRQRYDHEEAWRKLLHFFSNNNSCIRRSVWERIPYPDVEFAEDQIWASQIIEAGYGKAYAHSAVVFHSHNYRLIERLQRSFDESMAFRRLFGYHLCPNSYRLLRGAAALTLTHLRYAYRVGLFRTDPSVLFAQPLHDMMQVLGHYLGDRGDRLPDWLRDRLSWDKRLLVGLKRSNTAL